MKTSFKNISLKILKWTGIVIAGILLLLFLIPLLFPGKVSITKGALFLENTTFNIIDCIVGINAGYKDEMPTTAHFDAHFNVKDFSIQHAYKGIPMFHVQQNRSEIYDAVYHENNKVIKKEKISKKKT